MCGIYKIYDNDQKVQIQVIFSSFVEYHKFTNCLLASVAFSLLDIDENTYL